MERSYFLLFTCFRIMAFGCQGNNTRVFRSLLCIITVTFFWGGIKRWPTILSWVDLHSQRKKDWSHLKLFELQVPLPLCLCIYTPNFASAYYWCWCLITMPLHALGIISSRPGTLHQFHTSFSGIQQVEGEFYQCMFPSLMFLDMGWITKYTSECFAFLLLTKCK